MSIWKTLFRDIFQPSKARAAAKAQAERRMQGEMVTRAGYFAHYERRQNGRPHVRNPFRVGTKSHSDFEHGYDLADKHIREPLEHIK